MKFKRVVQTITYMPHFLSWVVVGAFVYQMLSPSSGIINAVLVKLGVLEKPIFFMVQQNMFVPIYLLTNLWKSTGYSIVIYLATISGIDPQLYDSAAIDGANRLHKVLYITLPALFPTMCTLLILNVGSLISVGFDPISTCIMMRPIRWRMLFPPMFTGKVWWTASMIFPQRWGCSRMWSALCWCWVRTGLPERQIRITRLFRPQEPSGTGAAGCADPAARRQAIAMGGRMP